MRKVLSFFVVAICAAVACAAAWAAKPVVGSVSGPVTSVKGTTFKLTTSLSPTGSSTVSVSSKTAITEQVTGVAADVKAGVCVVATGQKNAKGVVTALRVTITAAVKGACTSGFGNRPGGGTPPAGTAPPAGARPPGAGNGNGGPGGFGGANFGFAFGKVTSVKGATVTVKGSQGTTSVTLTKTTQIGETKQVSSSAIAVKSCAFVNGTSPDKGVTVKATQISLSKPGANGCTFGFRRP